MTKTKITGAQARLLCAIVDADGLILLDVDGGSELASHGFLPNTLDALVRKGFASITEDRAVARATTSGVEERRCWP